MSIYFKIKTAANYYLKSRTKYYLHSPFVYQLVSEVILDKAKSPDASLINNIHNELKRDKSKIEQEDLGASAYNNKFRIRSIQEMAIKICTTPKFGNLMHRLINHFQPQTAIELGTALGIGSLYINSGLSSNARFITHEGCQNVLNVAKKNFNKAEKEIETVRGNFDETLPETLETIDLLDFAYIDGNHTKSATLRYFNYCLDKINNKSVLVFDDIHWSEGMEEAWEEIKAHPRVTVTIDLFRIGIVFFHPEQAKEHFVIRY